MLIGFGEKEEADVLDTLKKVGDKIRENKGVDCL